jgi:uncharacterized membrane protein YedE/YeeE
MLKNLAGLLAGTLFGLGLAVSQMIYPAKIIAFLDFSGDWDPSLAVVLFAAVAVNFIGFRITLKQPHPVFAATFHIPTRRDIDRSLVLGAGIFGIGWGLAGYCPGPAISALVIGRPEPYIFLAALLFGSMAYRTFDRKFNNDPPKA